MQFIRGKRWELLQDYQSEEDGGTCERQQMPYTRNVENAAIAGALEAPSMLAERLTRRMDDWVLNTPDDEGEQEEEEEEEGDFDRLELDEDGEERVQVQRPRSTRTRVAQPPPRVPASKRPSTVHFDRPRGVHSGADSLNLAHSKVSKTPSLYSPG